MEKIEIAKEVIRECKSGESKIVLLLDISNSSTPYVSFKKVSHIKEDLVQGQILKEIPIEEVKEWLENNPNHSHNNEIRHLIVKYWDSVE